MDDLHITISEKAEIEKFLLINIIGILYLLENNRITIDESEKYLFPPYSVHRLQVLQVHVEIIDLIEHCCELEDIESLIPDKLNAIIREIKHEALILLEKTPESDLYHVKKWIDECYL